VLGKLTWPQLERACRQATGSHLGGGSQPGLPESHRYPPCADLRIRPNTVKPNPALNTPELCIPPLKTTNARTVACRLSTTQDWALSRITRFRFSPLEPTGLMADQKYLKTASSTPSCELLCDILRLTPPISSPHRGQQAGTNRKRPLELRLQRACSPVPIGAPGSRQPQVPVHPPCSLRRRAQPCRARQSPELWVFLA
jgi:hypothetical protein